MDDALSRCALYFVAILSGGTNSDSFGAITHNAPRATVVPFSTSGLLSNGNQRNWVKQIKNNIDDIRAENQQWKASFHLAELVLLSLDELNLKPDRVMAASDDGISFYFFRSDGYALIQCLESKEIVALTKEEESDTQEVWDVPIDLTDINLAAFDIKRFVTRQPAEESSPVSYRV
jgi:hypothetical protein